MNEDNENIQQHHKDFLELLSEARSGSSRSMGRLADIVRERLYSFVFRTTLDHDMTEDVLQETLLTMVGQIAHLREEGKFWAWVYRIAYNKLQDNLRARRNHGSVKASLLQNRPCKTEADNGDILEDTIQAERLKQLSEKVEQLSRQHKDVLRLRYYEQLPYTEIATLTRTTPQKARARFHRAKKHLKAQMHDDTQHGISVGV
jgi:RNA polymerase sigma-70 factor (ECF subfamily)